MAGESVLFSNLNELPPEAKEDKAFLREAGTKALAALPLNAEGRPIGALVMVNHRAETAWPRDVGGHLRLIADVFAGTVERKRVSLELDERLRFEALAAQLAAVFVNLPAANVDGAIEDLQGRFCTALGLDRSSLGQCFDQEPGALLMTHFYQKGDPALGNLALEKRADPRLGSNVYWASTETAPRVTWRRVELRASFHGFINNSNNAGWSCFRALRTCRKKPLLIGRCIGATELWRVYWCLYRSGEHGSATCPFPWSASPGSGRRWK